MKPQSQRQLRVGELVRQSLAEMFMRGEIYVRSVPAPHVTVSEVRMSPDLKNATAFVTPLGGEKYEELICELNEISGAIKKDIYKYMNKQKTFPNITFVYDTSFEQADRIHKLLID